MTKNGLPVKAYDVVRYTKVKGNPEEGYTVMNYLKDGKVLQEEGQELRDTLVKYHLIGSEESVEIDDSEEDFIQVYSDSKEHKGFPLFRLERIPGNRLLYYHGKGWHCIPEGCTITIDPNTGEGDVKDMFDAQSCIVPDMMGNLIFMFGSATPSQALYKFK